MFSYRLSDTCEFHPSVYSTDVDDDFHFNDIILEVKASKMGGHSVSDTSLLYRTLKNSASGTVAGIAVCLVGHPFDTLKVRLQTQPVGRPVYNGLVDCFIKTLKWEGIGGLYKGVGRLIMLIALKGIRDTLQFTRSMKI